MGKMRVQTRPTHMVLVLQLGGLDLLEPLGQGRHDERIDLQAN